MDPPPAYEKHSFRVTDSLQGGPAPAMGYGAPPPRPPQYQPYYVPPGAGFNPGPAAQPPQPVVIPVPQPTEAPDYLVYAIFTTICCCVPLGVAALYYSIQTRKANHIGDFTAAQKNSSLARNLAHTALGVGLFFIVLCIIIVVTVFNLVFTVSALEP